VVDSGCVLGAGAEVFGDTLQQVQPALIVDIVTVGGAVNVELNLRLHDDASVGAVVCATFANCNSFHKARRWPFAFRERGVGFHERFTEARG